MTVEIGQLFGAAVNSRIGLVRGVWETPHPVGFPPLFHYTAQLSRTTGRKGTGSDADAAQQITGSSVHFDRTSSLWGVLGEAFERYCASFYMSQDLPFCTEAELQHPPVPVREMLFYGADQLGTRPGAARPYRPDDARHWVDGTDLQTGDRVCVPAALVWMRHELSDSAENIAQTTSNGLGAGTTDSQAIMAGLCELVERDAFVTHWLAQRPGRPLVLSKADRRRLDPALVDLLDFDVCEISAIALATDIPLPVVLGVVRPRHGVGAYIGAACNPDPLRAVEKAVLEAFHTFVWITEDRSVCGDAMTETDIKGFEDHARYYASDARLDDLRFLWAGTPEPLEEFEARHAAHGVGSGLTLDRLVPLLNTRGVRVFSVDITRPDVAALGFCVHRVLATNLMPLYLGTRLIPRDRRRLKHLRDVCGWEVPEILNNKIHPFP